MIHNIHNRKEIKNGIFKAYLLFTWFLRKAVVVVPPRWFLGKCVAMVPPPNSGAVLF